MHKAAIGGLLATVALAVFAALARISGKVVAGIARRSLGLVSEKLGEAASEKILGFRDGLNAIGSLGDFLLIVVGVARSLAHDCVCVCGNNPGVCSRA